MVQYRSVSSDAAPEGVYVYDLSSTHGSYQNKNRLQPKVFNRLRVGHMLKFGGSSRTFLLLVCASLWSSCLIRIFGHCYYLENNENISFTYESSHMFDNNIALRVRLVSIMYDWGTRPSGSSIVRSLSPVRLCT